VGWQLLICRPSDWAGRDRMAVWRQMRRSGALSLGQGTWALPDDPEGRRRTDLVEDLIHRRHGHVLRFEVPDADSRFEEIEALVHAALDREWERLLGSISEAGSVLPGGLDEVAIHATLEELRRSYLDILDRERRLTASADIASVELAALVSAVPARALELSPELLDVPRPRLRARASGSDGPHRVGLEPFPGYRWELDFHEFERRTYMPSDTRPDLRHGGVTLLCEAGEIDAAIKAIDRRIETFFLSVGARTRPEVTSSRGSAA